MHRFVTEEAFEGEVVKITGSDFNHVSNSLRLKAGDEFIVSREMDWIIQLRSGNLLKTRFMLS